MTNQHGGHFIEDIPSREGSGGSNTFGQCGIAMILAGLIVGLIVYLWIKADSFSNKRKNKFDGLPQSGWLGNNPGRQVLTGPIADNRRGPPLMQGTKEYQNYMNAMYPPRNVQMKQGQNGSNCAVSNGDCCSNTCPSDLNMRCQQQGWSKEAVGEALALSSVGSYYLPSGVEEDTLHKVVALAHDPIMPGCANAGAK